MSKFIKKNKILSLLVIVTIIAVFFTNYTKNQEESAVPVPINPTGKTYEGAYGGEIKTLPQVTTPTPTKSIEAQSVPKDDTKNITILAGEVSINLTVSPNTIFYDALIDAQNKGKITFSGKNYPGLGFFITDIGSLRADNGKYLLYYINGKEATVGVSQYILKNGDVIEWKLE